MSEINYGHFVVPAEYSSALAAYLGLPDYPSWHEVADDLRYLSGLGAILVRGGAIMIPSLVDKPFLSVGWERIRTVHGDEPGSGRMVLAPGPGRSADLVRTAWEVFLEDCRLLGIRVA